MRRRWCRSTSVAQATSKLAARRHGLATRSVGIKHAALRLAELLAVRLGLQGEELLPVAGRSIAQVRSPACRRTCAIAVGETGEQSVGGSRRRRWREVERDPNRRRRQANRPRRGRRSIDRRVERAGPGGRCRLRRRRAVAGRDPCTSATDVARQHGTNVGRGSADASSNASSTRQLAAGIVVAVVSPPGAQPVQVRKAQSPGATSHACGTTRARQCLTQQHVHDATVLPLRLPSDVDRLDSATRRWRQPGPLPRAACDDFSNIGRLRSRRPTAAAPRVAISYVSNCYGTRKPVFPAFSSADWRLSYVPYGPASGRGACDAVLRGHDAMNALDYRHSFTPREVAASARWSQRQLVAAADDRLRGCSPRRTRW